MDAPGGPDVVEMKEQDAPRMADGAHHEFAPDTRCSLAGMDKMVLELAWRNIASHGDAIDLDASCVGFDRAGNFKEVVYFGNLANESRSVVHSGDNETGEGDPEEIVIDLSKIPTSLDVLVLAINSYSGEQLDLVEEFSVRILNASRSNKNRRLASDCPVLGSFNVRGSRDHTAMIMAKIYRDRKQPHIWKFHAIGAGVNGRSFGDILPSMQENLRDIIPNVRIQPLPKSIMLTKGETVSLKSLGNLSKVQLGLGWDMIGSKGVDLDASCCTFDRTGRCLETVSFSRLQSKNRSIRHAGDNLTGEGEGDDEKIYVDLDRLDPEVNALFFIVNSYSGDKFNTIKNAYVRLLDGHGYRSHELIRFSLTGSGSPDHTAMIMCRLTRMYDGGWSMKGIGHGTKGFVAQKNIGEMQSELRGQLVNKGSWQPCLAPHGGSGDRTLLGNSDSVQRRGLTMETVLLAVIVILIAYILLVI